MRVVGETEQPKHLLLSFLPGSSTDTGDQLLNMLSSMEVTENFIFTLTLIAGLFLYTRLRTCRQTAWRN